jgi:hypothetical protein
MAVKWANTLVAELAERRCIVFMGAGASMACASADRSRPPSWDGLLGGAIRFIRRPVDRTFARRLLAENRLLDAAEVIRECTNAADFNQYILDTLSRPRFLPSDIHKVILEIDPKIVITTNYDDIYDQYCKSGSASDGYNVSRYHDTVAVENLRSRLRLIIKAHGCVTDPDKLVLSRSSYYKAKRDYRGFYDVLDALFLTQTILFVGCSLSDPDVQLVLENANISAKSVHPHYALVEKQEHAAMRSAIKLMHNIELVEYPRGEHATALSALRDLRDKVLTQRAISA